MTNAAIAGRTTNTAQVTKYAGSNAYRMKTSGAPKISAPRIIRNTLYSVLVSELMCIILHSALIAARTYADESNFLPDMEDIVKRALNRVRHILKHNKDGCESTAVLLIESPED